MVKEKWIYPDEDTRLMMRVSEGDAEAYGKLYGKHFFTVVCFARNFNSRVQSPEDVAQEVFGIIWEKREQYRPAASFKTYLLGCARIVLLRQLKTSRKDAIAHEIWFLRAFLKYSELSCQPASEVDMSEAVSKVQKARSRLSDKQLQAVELFHDMHMSVSKAARLAKCTEKAFQCRLARAHKKLRQIMISIKKEEI